MNEINILQNEIITVINLTMNSFTTGEILPVKMYCNVSDSVCQDNNISFCFQGLVWLNVLVSANDGKSNRENPNSPIQYLQIESNHEGYRCSKKKLQFFLHFT